MAKQVQTEKQKKIDEDFLALVEESIKKDRKLLERLAKV